MHNKICLNIFFTLFKQVGLKPWEAMKKLKNQENENILKSIRPLRDVFAEETLRKLDAGEDIPVQQQKETK